MANDFTKNDAENLDAFNVHVPHDKVLQAFKAGIAQAEKEKIVALKKTHKKLKKVIWIPLVVAATASLILAAGKVNPALAKTFVNIPWIGQYFKANQDQLGTELLDSGRLFDINQPETIGKTTVTIDKAYYQASVVTVYGHVKGGDIIPENKKDAERLVTQPYSELSQPALPQIIERKGNSYNFSIQFPLKSLEMKSKLDFPFSLKNMNGATGVWKYKLHLTQKLGQTINLNYHFASGGYNNEPWSIDKVVEGDKLSQLYMTNNQRIDGILDPVKSKDVLHTEIAPYDTKFTKNNQTIKNVKSVYTIEGTIVKGRIYIIQTENPLDTTQPMVTYTVILRP